MSKLSERKTRLVAEFSETIRERGRSREVVMRLSEYSIAVKLKGTRTWFEISPASVYNLAVSKEVARQKAEKATAKKARAR